MMMKIRGALARGYCSEHNTGKVVDAELMEAMATEIETIMRPYLDALIWASAASDFAPGGVARVGFERVVMPLLMTSPNDNKAECQ